MTAVDHLQCALKAPSGKATISLRAPEPPDGRPEQAVDNQVGQKLHAMKYQTADSGVPRCVPSCLSTAIGKSGDHAGAAVRRR